MNEMPKHDFIYFGLTAEDCESYRSEKRAAKLATGQSKLALEAYRNFLTQKGNAGSDITEAPLQLLNHKLKALIQDIEDDPPKQERKKHHLLDNRAASVVFQELNDLPLVVLNDHMFWRYAAVHVLYDVVDWRYPQDNGARWGSNPTQNIRNVVFAWFVRGQLCEGYTEDELSIVNRVGDVDIWTSHVLAVLHGSSPEIMFEYFRQCVEWQNPNGSYSQYAREAVRDLAKQLKALRSNFVFDVIDKATAKTLVRRLAEVSEANATKNQSTKSGSKARQREES